MRLACLLAATCTALPAACAIGGKVVDGESGKPLPHTRVFARGFGKVPAILRVTDAEGAFCFEQLAPNTYEVVADKAGYLAFIYGARPGSDDGIPFDLEEPAEVAPLTTRMVKGATIAGTTLDAEGRPLPGASVQLVRKIWEKAWNSDHVADTHSDEDGGFRFSMMPPGTYYLSVAASTGELPGLLDAKGRPIHREAVETYYSGSYTFAHATGIPLRAGEERIGLAVTALQPASRRLSGRLSAELRTGRRDPTLELTLPGGLSDSIEVPVAGDGTFSADGLAAAEYQFSVLNVDPDASGTVDLAGGDVAGLVIEAQRTVSLQLSARIEGQDGPARVGLVANGKDGRLQQSRPDENGVYRFNLSPGIYRFDPVSSGPGQTPYLKHVLLGDRPQPDVWLDLRQDAPTGVVLVLGSKVAALDGRLDLREGEKHEFAVTVVAVDEGRSGVELKYETTVAAQTGEFGIGDLPPGKWRVFAIEGFEEGPWGSPELGQALAEKSVAVELQEGQTGKVKVPVIGTEEWEAALRKVGM